MLDICLLGVGGTFPLPKRFLTSLFASFVGDGILIDAGECTQVALRTADVKFASISTICITHFHGDHTLGIPGTLLLLSNAGRTKPVKIIGPVGIKEKVKGLLATTEFLGFDLIFEEITKDEQEFVINPKLTIKAFKVKHSDDIECFGYSINVSRDRQFLVDKANELNIPKTFWGILQKGIATGGFNPEDVLGPRREGLKVVYSTDTRPCQLLDKNAKQADLLILESMYLTDDKYESAVEKGHMLGTEAIDIGKRSKCRKLWLTHFSPMISNDEIREFEEKWKKLDILEISTKKPLRKTLYYRS